MSGLRAKRVRRCRRAGYPTREVVQARPELLAEHVPAEWIGKRELAGVLTAALVLQGGCGQPRGPGSAARPGVEPVFVLDQGSAAASQPAAIRTIAAVVAPVFEHGSGRAVTGGRGVETTFLREEEALVIIREELAKAGLRMSEASKVVEGVEIAQTITPPDEAGDKDEQDDMDGSWHSRKTPLVADLKDPQRGVVIEYVSEEDYHDLGGLYSTSTRRKYDFRKIATHVSRTVGKHGKGLYFGAFYDPAAESDPRREGGEAGTSARLLREQVKDFVEWLKGQGVI